MIIISTRWSSTNAMLNRFIKFYDDGIFNLEEFNNIDTKNGLFKNRQATSIPDSDDIADVCDSVKKAQLEI